MQDGWWYLDMELYSWEWEISCKILKRNNIILKLKCYCSNLNSNSVGEHGTNEIEQEVIGIQFIIHIFPSYSDKFIIWNNEYGVKVFINMHVL